MKIGVFDSGVGGKSYVATLHNRFPGAEIVYKEDKKNIPYGSKTPELLKKLTVPIFKQFEAEGCKAVLVACNTITTNIIDDLRAMMSIPLVGVEPMIKPAVKMSKTHVIAVCATPATLKSKRYNWLKAQYAENVRVVEPDCSQWASMIEDNLQSELNLQELVQQLRKEKVDVVVLGCTHYNWIEDELRKIAGPNMQVIQPIEPVLDQLERVLKES